jgi:N4-gp56 family major capsid protein
MNTYSTNNQRTQAYADAVYLARGMPLQVASKFGEAKKLPSKKAKTISMRRFLPLPVAGTLTEGVTPAGVPIISQDVTATVSQYGNVIYLSDVADDLSEDDLAGEYAKISSENRIETIESVLWGVLRGGTSVAYANGAARNAVNSVVTLQKLASVIRTIQSNRGTFVTEMIDPTTKIGTRPVEPSYVALAHTDTSYDFRQLAGFVPAAQYSSFKPVSDYELGCINNNIRIITAPHFDFFPDAGGAAGAMKTTSGTSADVYPVVVFGKQAFAQVMVGGKESGEFSIIRKSKSIADVLGQRSAFGWKQYYTAVILNQAWMMRLEIAVTAL